MPESVKLNIAVSTYGHTRALKDGAVPIEGVDANFVEVVPIIGAYRRMVRDLEFDVCEMAPTTYMIARARGAPYIALPIFLMRLFHHSGFVVRPDAGIKVPKDLEGHKVGVRAYSVTTGVWTRGIFTNEYGLDSSKVTWVVDDEEHVTTLVLPPNVVHTLPGQSLAAMMANGELQAGFTGPAGIGRAGPPVGNWETGGQTASQKYPELIADAATVEADWYRATGIYPIHSTVVIKEAILEKHPHVAQALLDAFSAAKQPYFERLKAGLGNTAEDIRYRSFGYLMDDPLPYGMKANATSIRALIGYAVQQQLIPSRPSIEEVFVDLESDLEPVSRPRKLAAVGR
jgi:4,5-dihydroxyphthalate decarboxylase